MDDIRNSLNGIDPKGKKVLGTIVPKTEPSDFELSSETASSRKCGDHVTSSMGSDARSILLGMGFVQPLVEKVIKEKGGEDINLLVETLFEYSAHRKSNSESSGSLDSLFDDEDEGNSPEIPSTVQLKEEPEILEGFGNDNRASLLMMNFSEKYVDFALEKLGKDAPIDALVEFITAAQIAAQYEKGSKHTACDDQDENKELNNGTPSGTREKAHHLLAMGFSKSQVATAIERLGSDVPLSVLADFIFANQIATNCTDKEKCSLSATSSMNHEYTSADGRSSGKGVDVGLRRHLNNSVSVKTEDNDLNAFSQSRNINRDSNCRGKRLKYGFEFIEERPKRKCLDHSGSSPGFSWVEANVDQKLSSPVVPRVPSSSRSLKLIVYERPYFFYGNVAKISCDSWAKISQFLYGFEPEYVNTQFFSALNRNEGYVHSLPTENRFGILPKPPMSIKDAIPHTKYYWPSWDTRKQLSCINSDISGISQLCHRIERTLIDSQGFPSSGQQKDILHKCEVRNLVWVGRHKLARIEPEHIEHILGYPLNHTDAFERNLEDRLESLRYCFQTDTLGYHLSVLKSMFPQGIKILSVFSGIGGVEVTLHRLGIPLRGVLSVEPCETKRNILMRWWKSTEQAGELVQFHDIQKLTSSKLGTLVQKFGGFDLVICQNPCIQSSLWKTVADNDGVTGFDFPLFNEFVRVLHGVRHAMERKQLTTLG